MLASPMPLHPPSASSPRSRNAKSGWLPRLALAALLGSLAVVGVGQEAVDPREEELARIRAEIGRLQERLGVVGERQNTLADELEGIKVELALQEAELAEATAAFDLAQTRTAAAESKVAELEIALAEVREDLGRRLVGLYRLGGQGYFRLFLTLEPDQELLPAIRQLRFLARRDRETFERFVATREALGEQRRRWESEKRDAERWRARESERRDALVEVRRRHERTLAKVEAERRRLANRTSELQDKEKKLRRLIDGLLGDQAGGLAGTPIQEFRGVLDWPMRGDVVGEFGPRKDPRYRTEVPHNGIDLLTEAGGEVRVIFPGEVLFSDLFEGYGPMVVVHHPGRVFTLYAGLQELGVEKGDVLSLGDVVGRSGDTLYFEVRAENQPENPRRWLR